MTPTARIIAKWRLVCLLSILAASALFAVYETWVVYFKPYPIFHTISLEEANRGWETSPDDNDPFLTDLLVKHFGWHPLPPNSVQHEWSAGFYHHAERYVIHLSPEEYADLKAHIDSTLNQSPKQEPFGKPSLGPDSSTANSFAWWDPPNKNAFSFSVWLDDPMQLTGNYTLEYDPKTQLLYIDANTV